LKAGIIGLCEADAHDLTQEQGALLYGAPLERPNLGVCAPFIGLHNHPLISNHPSRLGLRIFPTDEAII
jgi:hypothetical protein